ncbi:MAG: ABC transporter permease [Thermomicrobiales bacterium]
MIDQPSPATGADSGRGYPSGGWRRLQRPGALLWASTIVLLGFILVPLLAIFLRGFEDGQLVRPLGDPVVQEALTLSLITTAVSLVVSVLFGTPTAYLLARHRFRGRSVILTLIDLPMVLPPAVAGIALLIAFGRRGVLGPTLSDLFGIELPFTMAAVVMAQTFVAMPLYVRSARAGFETIDDEHLQIAATMGLSRFTIFRVITLPLTLPALLSGAVLTWARALGEFGATIMFAGNFIGRTQTMPLAIYQSLEGGDLSTAIALSGILIVVSFTVLVIFQVLTRSASSMVR